MNLKAVPGVLRQVYLNVRRLFGMAWRMDRKLTALFYITAALGALSPLAGNFAFKYLIDFLVNPTGALVAQIPVLVLVVLAARYFASLIDAIVYWMVNRVYLEYLFRYKFQNELNYRFYERASLLDVPQLEDAKVHDLLTKAKDTFTWRVPNVLGELANLLGYLITFSAAFIVLIPYGWWIPVVVTVLFLPRLFLQAKYGNIQWSIYGSGAPQVRKLWYLTWILGERNVIKELRVLQARDAILAKLKSVQEKLLLLNKKPLDLYLRMLAIPAVLSIAVLFVVGALKVPDVLSGAMTVGGFTLLLGMLDRLSSGVSNIVSNFGDIYANNLYVNYYFQVLDLPTVVKEDSSPVVLPNLSPPKIEFQNVSFAYTAGKKVLDNVSFTINPSENVALVGPNGAGKSTIVKLLCRFYDAAEGQILVNGVDLRRLSLEQWHKFLGTLFQDFFQYHFTVRENIALGSVRSTDEVALKKAAENSGAYDFIKDLPGGFDQALGREYDNGVELSIGQWQKLAIARAFYEDASVLILDEPTSAVDAEAEYEIFENLHRSYEDKTLIFVSHRFSTVRNADRIFVLEEGRITERGTHEELLSLGGKYAKMFRVQAKGYE